MELKKKIKFGSKYYVTFKETLPVIYSSGKNVQYVSLALEEVCYGHSLQWKKQLKCGVFTLNQTYLMREIQIMNILQFKICRIL